MSAVRSHRLGIPDYALAAAVSVLAVILFVIATPWGIGIRPDSAYYLDFPYFLQGNSPGYLWAIKMVAATGLDSIAAATVLNAVFLILNCVIVFGLVRGFGVSRTIAALAALLVLTSPLVFELHVTVLSEAMFIFLLVVTLALLSFYAGSGALTFLILAGLVSDLVFLTRFNGAPVWVVGVLTVAFLGPRNAKTRVLHAIAFLGAVILPLVLWGIIEARTGGTGLGREFGFLGNATFETLLQGATSIWVTFFPNVVPTVIKVLATLALIAILAAIVWQQSRDRILTTPPNRDDKVAAFPLIAAVYIFGHFALLLLSLLIEPNLPLKPSYFAPVYVLIVITGAQYSSLLRSGAGSRLQSLVGVCLLIFGALVLAANLARTGKLITEYRDEGIFFAGPQWFRSPLVAEINKLDPGTFVYTNAPDIVHLLTERDTEWLPMKFNRRTGKPLPGRPYEMLLAEMHDDLRQGNAVLAFFDKVTWRFYLPTQQELTEDLNLTELVRTEDGSLLYLPVN